MESHDPPFNWMQFAEGRARFAGGVRGVDERGHETFAVEVDGVEYFGEIVSAFLPNDNDYNIEVVSFGFADEGFAGEELRPGIALVLSEAQVATVAGIIRQLIVEGARMDDPPHLLVQYPNARFMGGVLFRDGWVLVAQPESRS